MTSFWEQLNEEIINAVINANMKEATCPKCNGKKEIEVQEVGASAESTKIKIKCPCCNGHGKIYIRQRAAK